MQRVEGKSPQDFCLYLPGQQIGQVGCSALLLNLCPRLQMVIFFVDFFAIDYAPTVPVSTVPARL